MHLSIYALRRSICASLHFALDIPIRSCPNRIDMRPFGARDGLCPTNPNLKHHPNRYILTDYAAAHLPTQKREKISVSTSSRVSRPQSMPSSPMAARMSSAQMS